MKKRLKETIFPIICLLEKKMNAWPELDRSRMEEPEDAFSHNSQGTEGGRMVSQKWESHVKYWMAFRGKDYGFHDADWRSGFGGQIYSHNGSHGCINMPTEAAGKLYKWLESDRIGGKAKAWVYYSDGNEFEKKEKNP